MSTLHLVSNIATVEQGVCTAYFLQNLHCACLYVHHHNHIVNIILEIISLHLAIINPVYIMLMIVL